MDVFKFLEQRSKLDILIYYKVERLQEKFDLVNQIKDDAKREVDQKAIQNSLLNFGETLTKEKEEMKHIFTLATIAVIILLLWFVLGFIVPVYIFKDINDGGVFGDGFGSVNALFTGLGFLGVSYTIVLQIEIIQRQKQQEKFELYLRLIEKVSHDIDSFEVDGQKGLNAIHLLIGLFKDTELRIVKSELNTVYLHYLLPLFIVIDKRDFDHSIYKETQMMVRKALVALDIFFEYKP